MLGPCPEGKDRASAAPTRTRLTYNPSGIGAGADGLSFAPEAAGDFIVRGVRVPTQPGTTDYFVLYEVPRERQERR